MAAKMNHLGNFADIIPQDWIDEILYKQGWAVPKDLFLNPNVILNQDEEKWFTNNLYDKSSKFFSVFYSDHCSFNVKLPFAPKSPDWWIVKMMPGEYIPVHGDLAMADRPHGKSYWMPWQDWEPGHVFVWEDQFVSNYKKGDVFEYDSSVPHCAINIGTSPRIILQIREY